MYSCALWGDEEGGVRADVLGTAKPGDLEAAQRRKLHHILRAARVKPGHRLLEFGTGWGALAITVRYSHASLVSLRLIVFPGCSRLRLRGRHAYPRAGAEGACRGAHPRGRPRGSDPCASHGLPRLAGGLREGIRRVCIH
jgi:hypothetical protein